MPDVPCLRGPVPFVMAHRGFDLDGRENSMVAFEAAVRLGVDFLETDVRVTSDGVLLAFHDARLDRVTDRRGRVRGLPWEQVRRARIRGSEPIPLLEDVLGAWPDVRVNVDLKEAATVGAFVEVVRRTKALDRVCVASFGDRRRADAVRALAGVGAVAWSPGIRRVVSVVRAVRQGPGAVRRALDGAACLQVPRAVGRREVVTASLVEAVHEAGAQVHVWTVDHPAHLRRMLDLGVDGLITNRSDLALPLVRERRSPPS